MEAKTLNIVDVGQIPDSIKTDLCVLAIRMAMKKPPAATGGKMGTKCSRKDK